MSVLICSNDVRCTLLYYLQVKQNSTVATAGVGKIYILRIVESGI